MKLSARSRRRVALSDAVGAILSMAITVIAGTALFGYVNNQARVSELNYAESIGATNNYLAENFKVIDLYFATSSQLGFWVYNTGKTNFQPFSVRLYDSAGQVNVLFNYTGTSTKVDRVYDLRASSAYYYSTCRLAGSSYESPTLSTVSAKIQNAQLLLLTIPPTTTNCPSYGQTYTTGRTYYIVVTGLSGNVVTYFQVK